MLRADMDALPVAGADRAAYASTVTATTRRHATPVMHACGHDMHVAWLAGATALARRTHATHWHGTLMAVFQPAEETAAGAQAMIDDGLFERFPKPDVVLGQHVMPSPAGMIGSRAGRDHLRRRQPRDPHVRPRRARLDAGGEHRSGGDGGGDRAAAADDRRRARSRQPTAAVVTVGALQAGTKENVIPDEAVIKLNVRTFDEGVRTHVLDAIKRIVERRSRRHRARRRPPEITPLDRYQLVRNDAACRRRVRDGVPAHFGEERVVDIPPISASEDFGSFGSEWHVPSVFWTVGGTDPETYREGRRRRAALPSCRPTTTRASRRCSTRRSRQASRRWSPRRAPGSPP